MQIRTRSRFIIAQSDTEYRFDVINGPSAEQILCHSHHEWDRSFGFEIVPPYEPLRQPMIKKSDPVRRVISYFIVPNFLQGVEDVKTGNTFHPVSYKKSNSQSMTDSIDDFIARQGSKELLITAVISKEARCHAYAYFGGGITASFGTRYDLKISYNPDTRIGSMTIKETE